MVLKLRPLVTVAGVRPVFKGVKKVEWLRPRLWEVLTIKLRGIEPGQILIHQKAHRGGMVLKLRPLVTVAGASQIFKGVRMAKWLRPGLWEVLTIKLRGIEPGQILIHKKPTREGWY